MGAQRTTRHGPAFQIPLRLAAHPYHVRQNTVEPNAPWAQGLADLLIQRIHPKYKNTDADLYLERYSKETYQDRQYRGFGALTTRFFQAEEWAITRAARRTLSIPEQLKTLTVVAASRFPDADFKHFPLPELAGDLVSVEKDWLDYAGWTPDLVRHKELVFPSDTNTSSVGSLRQAQVEERVIKQAESVF